MAELRRSMMVASKPANSVLASAPNKDAFPSVDPLDRDSTK
jgi:hypothetical protein